MARNNDWINRCQDVPIEGAKRKGRFSTWIRKIREDHKKGGGGINEADALDRKSWRGHITLSPIHTPNQWEPPEVDLKELLTN